MLLRHTIPALTACATLVLLPAAGAQAAPKDTKVTVKAAPGKKAVPFCETHKCIALTFDDGPSDNTTKLLATLKKYKAKATFFVMGSRVKKHPVLTKNIVKGGHELGNHTWSHPWLTDLAPAAIYKEINETQKLIKKTTGKTPTVFRAPGGLTDDDVNAVVAKLKLIQIPGTVATKDYVKEYRDVAFLTTAALEAAGKNAVVLMHETVKETVDSMPKVLSTLAKQGYSFVTVSKLLEGQTLVPGEFYPKNQSGELDDDDDFSGPAGEV
ncbi:polysaccharide deacetylase family protein [Acrocarpospora macrocephala]|uniref:Deacetylase n=1 Tax=Acrocarpospora macrocephala TaxID=150177 RepID=A0A5M3X5A0_9ACTN|nr:polysaccharide deacetylase family protein [Acrocarpospora macrocephala]GES14023.1 deacetylase [Acrocarpospora macrocephala]